MLAHFTHLRGKPMYTTAVGPQPPSPRGPHLRRAAAPPAAESAATAAERSFADVAAVRFKESPSLLGRAVQGLRIHWKKIAFAALALSVASLLTDSVTYDSQHAWTQIAATASTYHLPDVMHIAGLALNPFGCLVAAYRDNRKLARSLSIVGLALGAVPVWAGCPLLIPRLIGQLAERLCLLRT